MTKLKQMQPLYTIKDVTYLLCLTRQTVGLLVRRGDLHAIKLGRAVRFSPAEIERYIAARTQ